MAVAAADDWAAKYQDLERANAQLRRINETLMDRVERDMDHQGASFSLFQAAIALEGKVKERTAALSLALATLERTNRDLQASNEAALAASRAKSTFLATMSHELRTPMNGVVGMTELLLRSRLDAAQHASAEIIRDSAHSLLRILNDILDFSKIEAGCLFLEATPCGLRATVDSVLNLVLPQIEAKGLTFSIVWDDALPASVIGDSTRVAQIFTNLLGNALKFTQHGSITLRASLAAERGTKLLCRFDIEDSGIGIRPESLPHVFESFTQSDSSITRQFGGTGLGLAIVRRLSQLMGGDCGVSSEYGKGSRFWFTVELERDVESTAVVSQLAQAAVAEPDDDSAGMARRALDVLVVEDNLVNQIVVQGFLASFGCRCTAAENGVAAVRRLTAHHTFDLVLMDCQMPEMDGLEATRRVRAHEESTTAHIPIIALTANAMVGDRESCLAAGMDDFLSKPFRHAELKAVLQRWGWTAASVTGSGVGQPTAHAAHHV